MRSTTIMLLAAASLPAQLTTTFASNNQGAAGGAVYFTLTSNDPAGVTITDLELNFTAASTVGDIEVWLRCEDASPAGAGWLLVDLAPGVAAAGQDVPTPVNLNAGFAINANCTYGVALVALGNLAHRYTTGGAGFPLSFSAPGLRLDAGQATNVPFLPPAFSPRVVNTNINYVSGGVNNLDCGCVIPQGQGCGLPGAVPLQLEAVNRPVQSPTGPTTISARTLNIPTTAFLHIGIVGFARPNLPLAPIGMPPCFLHASADVIYTHAFAPPMHTWTVLVLPPLPPSLSGTVFNAQAAILGTPANPFLGVGGLTSNGLKFTIGSM